MISVGRELDPILRRVGLGLLTSFIIRNRDKEVPPPEGETVAAG